MIAQLGTTVPLDYCLELEAVGGLTGQSPTVAVRDASTSNRYLDWSTGLFATSGWTTKYGSMIEVERGHYRRSWNTSLGGLAAGFVAVVEYELTGTYKAVAEDIVRLVAAIDDVASVVNAHTDAQLALLTAVVNTRLATASYVAPDNTGIALLRKHMTNRLETSPGNPGQLILYDDDDVTPLMTHTIRSVTDGIVSISPTSPAKRSKGV